MQSSPLVFRSREYQAQGTQVSCQADATPQAQRASNTLKTGLTTASLGPRQAPAAAAPLLLAVPGLSVGVQCAPAAADGFAARAQPRVLGEVPGGAEFKSSSLLAREKEANPRKSQGSSAWARACSAGTSAGNASLAEPGDRLTRLPWQPRRSKSITEMCKGALGKRFTYPGGIQSKTIPAPPALVPDWHFTAPEQGRSLESS